MTEPFRRFARRVANVTGSAWAFVLAVLVVVAWLGTGPLYGYSNTWQLVINTGTTIITFLMVFLIQNTQNRDSLALHLKLDELIRALRPARNGLVDLEDLSDAELRKLQREFERLRRGAHTDEGQSFGELAVAAEQSRKHRTRRPERDRGDRAERGDRGERSERGERGERARRGDRTERGERGARAPQGERGEADRRSRRAPAEAGERSPYADEEGQAAPSGREEGEPRPPRHSRPPREGAADRGADGAEVEGSSTEGATGAERAERAERARKRRRRRRGGSGGPRREPGTAGEGAVATEGGAAPTPAPPPPAALPPATDGEP